MRVPVIGSGADVQQCAGGVRRCTDVPAAYSCRAAGCNCHCLSISAGSCGKGDVFVRL